MHVNTFDHYHDAHSRVHDLDPRVKVVTAVLFITSNALLPDAAWLAFALAWLIIVMIAMVANISPWTMIKRSFIVLPFTLAAVTVIFTLPGSVVWSGPWGLTATDAGLSRFTSILLRSWLSVQVAILLIMTTRFPDVLHALRHLKMPAILVSILAFMYRYLFVLADEALRLLRARQSRSARLSGQGHGGSIIWRARVTGSMAGQLFLRSFERSDRVYNAMLARGYVGELLTMSPHAMVQRDWLALFGCILLLVTLQLVGRIF